MEYKKKITSKLIEEILSKGVRDMPQNPSAQGYSERQIRTFYYSPEQHILLALSSVEDDLIKALESINKGEGGDLSAYQLKIDESLETEEKEIAKAINEVNGNLVGEISSNLEGKTLTITIKDKGGDVIATTNVDLPSGGEIPEIDLSAYQPKTDNTLETESKEVVGAINELNSGKVGINDIAIPAGGSNPASATLGLTKYLGMTYGGLEVDKNGLVKVFADSSPRTTRSPAYRCPITAYYFNDFLKESLCGDYHPLVLTEEEKASALNWLGAKKYYKHQILLQDLGLNIHAFLSSSLQFGTGQSVEGFGYYHYTKFTDGAVITNSHGFVDKITINDTEIVLNVYEERNFDEESFYTPITLTIPYQSKEQLVHIVVEV